MMPDTPTSLASQDALNQPLALPLGPLIIDVEGKTLGPADRRRLTHPLVGGVILFARNFESRKQVAALTAEIAALRTPRLLVCVDHEGGRVQRFKKGFTEIPPMRDLGAMWEFDVLGACKRATELGQIIGNELIEVGIDLSFTPVLDLDYGASSVIGDRALHADPRTVAMLARCLTHGLLLSGMANCGKHFPGHGFAHADSHYAVPVDERSLATILAQDAAPYEWMGDTLASVMPAHVIYPQVDSKPAGFSRKWIQDVLRKQMGFNGAVISDDLTMEGASVAGNIVQRAKAALAAGCDLVLVCNRPDLVDELLGKISFKPNALHAARVARLLARSSGSPASRG
jgi:beta-N-acetylhexosaminidase